MWHTEIGDRILTGAEAVLFAETLTEMVEICITEENDYDFGIQVFDDLTYNQKLFILLEIANGLFKPTVKVQKLTAVNEGAIAAVFENMKALVQMELDDNLKPLWRKLIWDCLAQIGKKKFIGLRSKDYEKWEDVIEILTNRILWDLDYLDNSLADLPPEHAEEVRRAIAIDDDYYSYIPNDPSDKQTRRQISELRKLCARVVKQNTPEKDLQT